MRLEVETQARANKSLGNMTPTDGWIHLPLRTDGASEWNLSIHVLGKMSRIDKNEYWSKLLSFFSYLNGVDGKKMVIIAKIRFRF